MRKIFFISLITFLFLVSFSSFISAQEELPSVREEPLPFESKIIRTIEIIGNRSISTNTILSKIKSRVGQPYQENIINDDIKRLYLLGFFSDISVKTEDVADGVKVIINVVERPILEKISFEGMKRIYIKEDKLKEMLKSKEKEYLDYVKLREDVDIIKELYVKKGYLDTQVEYKLDLNKDKNTAKVIFIVQEARRLKIKKIEISGNDTYPDKKLLKLMKTKRAWLFNPGVLKEDVFNEDIERLRAFYRYNGFADVEVDYKVRDDPKKPSIYIDIQIKEGKKYVVGKITIAGNSVVSEKEIRSVLKNCSEGKVFSQEALQEDISNIQGIYFDKGYIFASIKETVSMDPDTQKVDVSYRIIENEVGYVNKIKVRGNVRTKDVVIRRELRIYPGERFDGEKLRRSKERLQNLGFFEEISYDIEDTDVHNKKDLIVEVKEAKTGMFSFGGGYSSVDQFVGFVEIEQRNFDWKNFPYFTGDGQNLRVKASMGTLTDSYLLSFTEPWFLDYSLSLGFDIYRERHERESDVGYGYDEKRTGGDVRLGKELTEYLRTDLIYRYDNIEISGIAEDATQDLKKEEGKNSISSIEFILSQDKRDNRFLPSRGYFLSTSIQVAGGSFGGDKDFLKFFARGSKYFPLWYGSVLEFRLRIGLVDAYSDSEEVPIYERFFVGGAYTIRGYEERKIGPYDLVTKDPLGGESLMIGNIEYTYPLFDFLRVATFFDSGNVWEKVSDLGKGDFKSSFGLGLRLKTPMGPINLDYGVPLNKAQSEEKKSSGRFHFSVGYGF
ncbi:MAG: outer membrane protein assembly factor BamA [Candidatus Omnitrophica bacterium]|nr:outer membrane protein assembly factor BamA [Candidatus Omnitrophota bacterium]